MVRGIRVGRYRVSAIRDGRASEDVVFECERGEQHTLRLTLSSAGGNEDE